MANAVRHISPAKKMIPGKSTELSVIIPAAGLGRRMKSKKAKLLTEVTDEQSIVTRQIEMIWKIYPKADILLIIGSHADEVRKALKNYPVRLIYNPIFENTNVSFSISLGLQASLSNKCLLIYGDLVFNEDSILHITEGQSKLLIDVNNTLNDDEVGVVIDENKHVSNLAFGLEQKWSQIAYLQDRELELFKSVCYNGSTARWFGYESLNQVLINGGTLESYIVSSARVFDIDTNQDLHKAKLGI